MVKPNALLLAIGAFLLSAMPLWATEDRPRFEDYPVETVYHKTPHPAVLVSHEDHRYQTMLRTSTYEKVNFAGHYIVKQFGAGACAVSGFVMDAKTGKAAWFPYKYIACTDPHYFEPVKFQLHSSLIVFQGMPNETEPNGEYYFNFKDGQFIPVKTVLLPGIYPEEQAPDEK